MAGKEVSIKLISFTLNALALAAPQFAGKLSFRLFCTPFSGKLKEKDKAFLASSDQQEFIEVPDGQIKSYVWNQQAKNTVLLLHGWESNSARWRNLIPILTEANLKVVSIDAPAHGASTGKLFNMLKYAEAINHGVKKYQPQAVVGHSLGGASMMYYLAHDNADFEKVIVLATPSGLLTMISGFINTVRLSDRTRQGLFDYFENRFGKKITYFSNREFAKSLNIRSLIIHDTEDKMVPYEEGEQIHKNFAGTSELMTTTKKGHSLQHKSVYLRIRDFLVD